jgi:hypothetical protein
MLRILKTQINVASKNLLLASRKYPMYGTLIGIQYLFLEINYNSDFVKMNILEWRDLHKDILQLIDRVCQIVLKILSDPSPEGNLPEGVGVDDSGRTSSIDDDIGDYMSADYDEINESYELEMNDGDDNIFGPRHQIILSCCWRTVKEASTLLAIILSRVPFSLNLNNDDHEKSNSNNNVIN